MLIRHALSRWERTYCECMLFSSSKTIMLSVWWQKTEWVEMESIESNQIESSRVTTYCNDCSNSAVSTALLTVFSDWLESTHSGNKSSSYLPIYDAYNKREGTRRFLLCMAARDESIVVHLPPQHPSRVSMTYIFELSYLKRRDWW